MPDAVALAIRNAEHLAIRNVRVYRKVVGSARYRGSSFDMIVSNPSLAIDAQDPHLSEGDVRFETRARRWWRTKNGMADLTHKLSITPA